MKSKLTAVLLICLSLVATDACAGKTTAEKAKPGKAVPTQQQPVSSISKILTPYIAIWKTLKNNTITGVPENAEALIEAAKSEIAGAVKTKKSDEYKSSLETIIKAAQLLDDKQSDIRKTRIAFGTLGDLIVDFTGANFSDEDMKDYKSYYCGVSKHYSRSFYSLCNRLRRSGARPRQTGKRRIPQMRASVTKIAFSLYCNLICINLTEHHRRQPKH